MAQLSALAGPLLFRVSSLPVPPVGGRPPGPTEATSLSSGRRGKPGSLSAVHVRLAQCACRAGPCLHPLSAARRAGAPDAPACAHLVGGYGPTPRVGGGAVQRGRFPRKPRFPPTRSAVLPTAAGRTPARGPQGLGSRGPGWGPGSRRPHLCGPRQTQPRSRLLCTLRTPGPCTRWLPAGWGASRGYWVLEQKSGGGGRGHLSRPLWSVSAPVCLRWVTEELCLPRCAQGQGPTTGHGHPAPRTPTDFSSPKSEASA